MEPRKYKEKVPIDIRRTESPAALAREAAEVFAALARASMSRNQRFTVALSGGETPKALFDLLGAAYQSRLDWTKVHVFWVDERPVPPTHPASNYLLAKSHLLDKVSLPASHIHRIHAEHSPHTAAQSYSRELCEFFGLDPGAWPRFDLILLGVGEDGHTASLFPGSRALENITDLVVDNPVEKLQETRLTLTFPVINAAASVLVLASGSRKSAIVRKALVDPPYSTELPIQGVRPERGQLIWILDGDAAAELNS